MPTSINKPVNKCSDMWQNMRNKIVNCVRAQLLKMLKINTNTDRGRLIDELIYCVHAIIVFIDMHVTNI